MRKEPAVKLLWGDKPFREISIFVDGTVHIYEDGQLIPTPEKFIIINRIPELIAQARAEGKQS